jgi:NTP pyrophosphatase (non-canonical NTP hydrolase)
MREDGRDCAHLRERLQSTVLNRLRAIQSAFDDYQTSCFVERPSEFFALELCGEAGELANLEKKCWRGQEIEAPRIADEAADVFIALMNYCNARGIELDVAVSTKISRIQPSRL